MTLEKWQEIKDKVKEKFTILENYKEKDDERREDKEFLIFEGPLGKIRLEFMIRPVIIDKKTNYSRRIGGQVDVDYIYSEDEFTYSLKVFRYIQAIDAWEEMKAHQFQL